MRIVRKFLLWLILLLIPFRDWSFDVGISFYAIDIPLVVAALDYIASMYRRRINMIGLIYISLMIPAAIPIICHMLIGEWQFLLFAIIGVIKFLIYVLALLWVKDLYSRKQIKITTDYFAFIAFIIISAAALVNFYTISVLEIDFLGDLFDVVSIRPEYIPENHLKLNFWIRNTSFAGEPNFLGIWSILSYLFLIKSEYGRRYKGFLLFLCGLLVISTFSRIAIALFGILIVSYILQSLRKRWFIILPVILAVLILNPIDFTSMDKFSEIVDSITNRNFKGDDGRLEIFSQAFQLFQNNPLGYGLSNYGRAAERYDMTFEPNPHNSFLIWLVETGVIGLVWFLFFLTAILRSYYRKYGLSDFLVSGSVLLVLFVNVFDKVFGFFLLLFLPLISISNEYYKKYINSNNLL